mmetsp:Transcript_10037/g.15280  ORF Transcript_10037/g.15280 Transcript_10037/m.15280 type:complete len:217 (-) Transcript_10037:4004-4654(-)
MVKVELQVAEPQIGQQLLGDLGQLQVESGHNLDESVSSLIDVALPHPHDQCHLLFALEIFLLQLVLDSQAVEGEGEQQFREEGLDVSGSTGLSPEEVSRFGDELVLEQVVGVLGILLVVGLHEVGVEREGVDELLHQGHPQFELVLVVQQVEQLSEDMDELGHVYVDAHVLALGCDLVDEVDEQRHLVERDHLTLLLADQLQAVVDDVDEQVGVLG